MADEIKEEYLEFLDNLRNSGIINMFGARPYLMSTFELDAYEAQLVLQHWMATFGERHKKSA